MKQRNVQKWILALMVLRTPDVRPSHGYAVTRRIEQISGDPPFVNQETLYP
jgi:DNA-binding PadR family transcriptional regulator